MSHQSRMLPVAALALAASAVPALAHGDHTLDAPLLFQWTWHTGIIVSLAGISLLYFLGLRNLWRSAGIGRGVSTRQAWVFAAAMLSLVVALLSPVDPLSEELAWMHMVQHKILMMVAAPLFIAAAPATVLMWAFPSRQRRHLARWMPPLDKWRLRGYLFWQPLLTWGLFAAILWVWHLPILYEAALANWFIHDIQHIAFFLAACLFWRVLLDPLSRLRLNPLLGVVYLFTASLQAMFLGVYMALAPDLWYPWYDGRTDAFGLSPLEDQQLAGIIMWMPGCIIYAIAAAAIFGLWLRNREMHESPGPAAAH